MRPSKCFSETRDLVKSQLSGYARTMRAAVVSLMTCWHRKTVEAEERPTAHHMLPVQRGHLHVVLCQLRRYIDQLTPPLVVQLDRAFSTCRLRLQRVILLLNDYRHR